ncbi:MAG: PKD domain-containing protein [Bacteroidales bacterium]|nr:PKD domain-containing protein [Bacteroidales bacterium]MCF6341692.1 PKD domain-containing protein [Bacteroidales bacterium]
MKRIVYFILILLIDFSWVYGQLPDPITGSTTEFGVINSDYGPRNVTIGSLFHNGIDYQCPLGVSAFAVEEGDITAFNEWHRSIAYIRIVSPGNVRRRYMHVETGTYTDVDGNDLWEYCPDCLDDDTDHDNFIILRYLDNSGSLRTQTVLTTTEYTGEIWVFKDITGDIVPISTQIGQSEWIFMPGDYTQNAEPYPVHLHIGPNWGQRINPFSTVSHSNTVDPIIEMPAIKRVYNNQATVFQDEDEIYGSPIIFEAKVNTTDDKDLNIFSITCQNKNNQDVDFSENWRIAGQGHNVYIADIIITNPMTNELWIQNNISEGVYPYDPIDQNDDGNADPGHDYFKLHWPSKKSTVAGHTEAYVNQRAVYPDGKYDITFTAEDISGNASTEPRNNMVLDNHQPYVQEVSIYSGKKIYGATVDYIDPTPDYVEGKLKLTVDQQSVNDCADYENKIEIFVITSEPMQDVSIKIPDAGIPDYSIIMVAYYGNPTVWQTVIEKSELPGLFEYSSNYQMIINGQDMADNQIVRLGMSENGSEMNASWLPHRLNDGNWQNNLGTGENGHKIPFCSTDLIKAMFHSVINNKKAPLDQDMLYGYSPLTITFNDASTGDPTEWIWDFGDNSLPVNEQNPQHTFVNEYDEPIQYNVTLKACNETGCDITLKNKLITVYPEGYSNIPIADFTFSQKTYYAPYVIQFYNYSAGNIITYNWDFGDGASSTEPEPEHQYTGPDTYMVKLILNKDLPEEITYETEVEVLEASTNFAPIDFEWTCIANTDNMYNGEGLTGELIDFKSSDQFYDGYYEWDMGDGIFYYLNNPSHAYLNSGVYAVTLTIRNFSDELVGHKTKLITVVPKNELIPAAENEIVIAAERIEDVELLDDEDFLFIATHDLIYLYEFNSNTNTWDEYAPQQTIDPEFEIWSISVSGDLLLVGSIKENDYSGNVYFYKRINNLWVKQSQVLTPDEYWLRFGHFTDMDNGTVLISSYNEQNEQHQVSIWEYNESSNLWYITDRKYTAPHPTPPKLSLSGDIAIINSKVYKKGNNSWQIVDEGIAYDDAYQGFSGSEKSVVGTKYLATSVQDIENPHISLSYYDGQNFVSLPDMMLSNEQTPFGSSLAMYDNYFLSGNYETSYLICNGIPDAIQGSSILYRANSSNYFYRYLTIIPSNGIVNDGYGTIVKANKNNLIITSRRVLYDDGSIKKYPGVYYYHDYAYFGDRELILPSIVKYNTKQEGPLRLEARNIEIGGENAAAVSTGENLELIGQRVVLSPGFSATNGAVFRSTGTICTDYFEPLSINQSENETVNETVYLTEFKNSETALDKNFIIVPNPGNSKVDIIAIAGDLSIMKVEVYDLNGKLFLIKNANHLSSKVSIDVSSLPKGVCVVAIYSGHNVEKIKFIKL